MMIDFKKALFALFTALAVASCGGPATSTIPHANAIGRASSSGFNVVTDLSGSDGMLTSGLTVLDGVLYGSSPIGGPSGAGAFFAVTPGGTLTIPYNFNALDDAVSSKSRLVALNGVLYGTSLFGGCLPPPARCSAGVAYSITPSGTEHILHWFGGVADGQLPTGALTLGGQTFYGVTQSGGTGWPTATSTYGFGTVYSMTAAGVERVLHSFRGTDGNAPSGALAYLNGTLYGTTTTGGKYSRGVFFSVTPSGQFKKLYDFGSTTDDAIAPEGDLVYYKGLFYGVSASGGGLPNSYGTVYTINPQGTETVIHRFAGGHDGAIPSPGLLLLNGAFYGAAFDRGDYGVTDGTLFKITPKGVLTTLHSFSKVDGAGPGGELTAIGTTIYGVTQSGGANTCANVLNNCGVIFSYST